MQIYKYIYVRILFKSSFSYEKSSFLFKLLIHEDQLQIFWRLIYQIQHIPLEHLLNL